MIGNNNFEIAQLKDIIITLQQTIQKTSLKNMIQKQIFTEYIKIFKTLSQKLTQLSSKINDQILSAQDQNDQSIGSICQHLSNSLLRMADCARHVGQKAQNEVLEPMKLFICNYQLLNKSLFNKLKIKQLQLSQLYLDLSKNKQNYTSSSQKLSKYRKLQQKSISKIQNGDITQLQKFNNNIKRITQSIKLNQQTYIKTIKQINQNYDQLRSNLKQIVIQLSHNQQSRICFSNKNLICSIRILQGFKSFYDNSIEKKIQDLTKKNEQEKGQFLLKKNLNNKIQLLSSSTYKQQFISYQESIKLKKKKQLQEENAYLNQIFVKVKDNDKNVINKIVQPWFQNSSQLKKNASGELTSGKVITTPTTIEVDFCKQKIQSATPYSFYFIQTIYQKINDMNSFYCKLGDEDFFFLLNMFTTITSNLQLQQNTHSSAIAIQFVYKIIQISMRIMRKKNVKFNKGQSIDLLCHQYGKKCKCLNNEINLKKLYLYIQKKKLQKKNIQDESLKSMMTSFVKGMMRGKKQQILTQDQYYNCLTQITQMIANLLIPSQISIPFIKSLLKKNQNLSFFQYLKSILLQKKDIHQRQKIFYQTQIKDKKQSQLKTIIQNQKIPTFCIQIAVKRGFFTKDQLSLRLVCSQLKNVHRQILYRLGMQTKDWIHLIPLNRDLNYIAMKQQVAQDIIPTSIQQIITLDVNRSLHNHGQVLSPTILHSMLRTYAHFHKDISYCQGMNYIAGYLYIKTKDQQSAYRIFQYLMQIRFKQLFARQFQVLKIKMYQFQRLLAIFHPQISQHFKKQAILPQCFIVSWIITLFASSYQYTMDSYIIDVLWERFIIWGWGEFFRFVLTVFNMYKDQLSQMAYDKALHLLGELSRSELFLANKEDFQKKFPDSKIQQLMQQFPITEELLQNLKKELN